MKALDERYQIDDLAEQAGGYFAPPAEEDIAYTDLLFDVCEQFGIHYGNTAQKRCEIKASVVKYRYG